MAIPRWHLFELEDQPWFPAVVRDLATDYLHFIEARIRFHRPIVPLLADVLRRSKSDAIVDLCSGGSGPIPEVVQGLAGAGLTVRATLTDRYPNIAAFSRTAAGNPAIGFVDTPIDARNVPRSLAGVRTLFNAFHHFRPADAAAILRDAVESGAPIGIFEVSDRTPRTILSILLTPLVVMLVTPFITPFRWRRLFWTYLVPLVPLTCVWDGVVSQFRAYTVAELHEMSARLPAFDWEAGQIPVEATPVRLTYLVGRPGAER